MRGGVCAAALAQAVEVGERQHVLDARTLDLRALLLVLDEDADGARVLEQVQHVVPRARGVDRRADRADERQGEVEQRPLEAGAREQAERVALLDAEREQAVRELVDRPAGFGPRDGLPFTVDLVQVGGSCRAARRWRSARGSRWLPASPLRQIYGLRAGTCAGGREFGPPG